MIDIRNLSKSYGEKMILDNINLVIPKNKMSALLGANGAGKSTLLKILSQTIKADCGDIYIEGKSLNEFSRQEFAQTISMLHQSNHNNLKLRVRELIEFGRFPYCQGRLCHHDINVVNEAIAFMNLETIENSYLDELSGGQQQRAYIAMIIAQDTPYVLLDEPLNNLDLKYSVEFMKNCQRLVTELNKTVVIIMHDLNFTSMYCDECVFLKDCGITHQGPSDKLLNKDILKSTFGLDFDVVTLTNNKRGVHPL